MVTRESRALFSKNEFFEYVKKYIKEYLPEEFSNAEVLIQNVEKNNGVVHAGLIIRIPEDDIAAQRIYLDHYFDALMNGDTTVHEVMKQIAQTRLISDVTGIDHFKEMACDWNQVKSLIVGKAVNTSRNQQMLEKIPHYDKLDLSMTFGIYLSAHDGLATARITNDIMKMWGMNEKDLYEHAMENMERFFPFEVINIETILKDVFKDMPEEMLSIGFFTEADEAMYVLSNTIRINGAAVMFADKPFAELAEKLGSDLYIMPSSVNEVMAVSARNFNSADLAEMVRDINGTQIDPEEQLSDCIYRYNKERHCLEFADDAKKRQEEITNQMIEFPKRRGGRL